MNTEQQQYIDDMRDLFQTEGWKWVETDCQGLVNMYKEVDSIESDKALWFAKGVLFAARSILTLPDIIRDAEEEEDAED